MDSCSVAALIPTAEQVKTGLSVLGSVVIAASVLTSATPTPAPGTRAARLYHYLEFAALLFGRAKDTGALSSSAASRAIDQAVELVRVPPRGPGLS